MGSDPAYGDDDLYQYRGPWPGDDDAPEVAEVPDGQAGSWGFFVAQLVGLVDGVPQHVGETTATVGRSGGGAYLEFGDWSTPGHLFSTRSPTIDSQPPYEPTLG